MTPTFYALRSRRTGKFLPGTSHPTTETLLSWNKPPRLFKTRGTARLALQWWLSKHTWSRSLEEMEIVEVEIRIIALEEEEHASQESHSL